MGDDERQDKHQWTFFTNYGHILLALAQDPAARLRDLADRVGITERAVHRVLAELEAAAVITRQRHGRRNRYSIRIGRKLRHPIESHRTVGDLIDLVQAPTAPTPRHPKNTGSARARTRLTP